MVKKGANRYRANLLAWTASFLLFVAGLATLQFALGARAPFILAWLIFSCAILVLTEQQLLLELYRWLDSEEPAKKKVPLPAKNEDASTPPSPGDANVEKSKDDSGEKPESGSKAPLTPTSLLTPRRWAVLGIVLLLAAGSVLASHSIWPQPNPSQKEVADHLQRIETELSHINAQPRSGGPSGPAELHLNPEIERALADWLNRKPEPPPSWSTWGPLSALVVLGILIIAGILTLTAKKHPSAAAPVGAAGISIAIVNNADHLSRLDQYSFRMLLVIAGGATLFFLVLCLLHLLFKSPRPDGPDESAHGSAKTEGKVVDSPLNVALSLMLVIWAGVYAVYHAQSVPAPPPPAAPVSMSHVVLNGPFGFVRGKRTLKDDQKQVVSLEEELATKMSASGSYLLLLGSTDCTEFKSSNNATLAKERAQLVRDQLVLDKRFANDSVIRIRSDAVPQHETCKEAASMRAVFPVLMHPDSAKK